MAIQQVVASGMGNLSDEALATFSAGQRGAVLRPESPGYDDVRQIWNGLIDRRPALIARCSGALDVINAVNFARDNDLVLSVRGGGHNVAGNAVCDGGLMIDLSLMCGVHVDPVARTARAQGGATWADIDRETQVFGLATPGGVISTTGIGGLTLHGGLGYLRRKHGLSIDNLLSVDIVTADGELRTASKTENADLFWAVRGAGSNFGVVTSFEFQLHPVGPAVMVCAPFYSMDDAPHALAQWRDFMATAPEEIASVAIFWSIPSNPPVFPEELRGLPVLILTAFYVGPVEEGERAMQPLRELATPVIDLSGPDAYTAVQSGFDAFFPNGNLAYWKSRYVDGLSDDLIQELCRLSAERPSPLGLINIWQLGGAMSRVGSEETAFGSRSASFMLSFDTSWTDPADTERNIAWTRGAWAQMQPYSSGGLYINFPGFGEEKEDLVRAAYGQNYERLAALKTKYDPTNLFRMNQNIKPSGERGI